MTLRPKSPRDAHEATLLGDDLHNGRTRRLLYRIGISTSNEQTIRLSPTEQIAFWNALRQTPELSSAERQLAAIMRGEA
jgi:hypothetical protein